MTDIYRFIISTTGITVGSMFVISDGEAVRLIGILIFFVSLLFASDDAEARGSIGLILLLQVLFMGVSILGMVSEMKWSDSSFWNIAAKIGWVLMWILAMWALHRDYRKKFQAGNRDIKSSLDGMK